MRLHLLIALFLWTSTSFAGLNPKIPYYGDEFYSEFSLLQTQNQNEALDEVLKDKLYRILSRFHIPQNGKGDLILERCPANQDCVSHQYFSYNSARKELFGTLHLNKKGSKYFISCVYCNIEYSSADFPKNQGPGPGRTPDPRVINAEHTWPQSRFNRNYETGLQKSDLHALFPTTASTNTQRGNLPFGVVQTSRTSTCPDSKRGLARRDPSSLVFEPPRSHKGNVARAIFYFATRYQLEIEDGEEEELREWHKIDPVDEYERTRHEEIFRVQQVRNPFIDHPDLVQHIQDF